ncbi:MAG: hypothetical protein KAT13_03215, partial [Methanosarcinales archaeon]|nr:hypothetical protein [Methanosarcinales archaeon]
VAVMALDILRKMHDNEQDPEYDACETEVVDAVNEALGQTEPEIITLTESLDDAEEVVAVAEPETTPEPAEVEATTIDATETQPEQMSHETQKTDTVIEIPVSSYAVSEDSDVPDTADNSVGLIDSQTTEPEPEPVTAGSGFPGLPDDEGLSDLADSMDGATPELGSEPASPGADFPGLPEDSEVHDTADNSVDLIDSQMTEPEPEPEPVVDGSGFPGLPDDEGFDSADSMDGETPELGSEPASPVDFPGLSEDSDVSAPADMAGSPFDDDPDQMPAFPDDGDMSGLPEPAESNAGGELEHQWNQTVQRIKELKTRYVVK